MIFNRRYLIHFLAFMILLIPFSSVYGHGGNTVNEGEISLSLEEIYVITFIVALISPMILLKIAKINDKKLTYILTSIAIIFLTIDYLVLKFIIFA